MLCEFTGRETTGVLESTKLATGRGEGHRGQDVVEINGSEGTIVYSTQKPLHLQIGKPGDSEGAAGSIYVTVPVVLYGKFKSGGSFSRKADVILRRVNDVPGSTEAQRRWHIERINWAAAG